MTSITPAGDDDFVWAEIDKKELPKTVEGDVVLKINQRPLKGGKVAKARVFITFRNEAALWVEDNMPRFRLQVGGRFANVLRLVPDQHNGKFEAFSVRGVYRMVIPHIEHWPDEPRDAVSVEWDAGADDMRLTLPEDFTKPRKVSAHG